MASINTNANAMSGLRMLNMTQTSLSKTQSMLETGLKVNSAKDAPATFVIAQGMRSEIGALGAIGEGIAFGEATIGVAMAGATEILKQLSELETLATQAQNDGLDDAILSAQAVEVLAQITAITAGSEFNGVNLINNAGTDVLTVPTDLAGSTMTYTATNLDATTLSLTTDFSDATNIGIALTNIAAAQTTVGNALTAIGTFASRLESQGEFTQLLTDTMKEGLGVLVDADMAAVAAELTALQTKEQLNIQSLSIANQAPQSILALFR
ncbi:flagellin [Sneathiella sp.]|uniref:flagellin n=1 Tax=Sneathiella sp. TaxID=1964365 RepID=UPI0026076902|nr:flagellin [Sneathiella sp.]MDF2367959.1 flagellin [Sneathiella sp.]